ncbi:2-oxopent-4-enoate hydratase [Arthrobacter sp. AK01]|uniref:2-keto-4-pentenoate hydratase n=1 Tax=Arthrobacter sp. AK01 TaxID=2894084 RepID=UPI001E4515F0|nr:fumarylacetoacetate hydrolase family protein [Arthrobacter sp. AK01]MCD4851280.1 2-oxopent-4-enoate hydratase [Arthrobacter sp. AK01]
MANVTTATGRQEDQLAAVGAELLAASESLIPVPPLRDRVPGMTLQDAYTVQQYQLHHHLARGRVLAGRKVGLTSRAIQQQLGVDSPDFGYFFEDMVHHHGAEIPASHFIQPKVEPEFGFVLKTTLAGPGVTRGQAAAAIEAVYPAIEIIDSRITDWDIKLVDTVADNASCGAIAVGSVPLPVSVDALGSVTCDLLINGEVRESGTGGAVMGDPVIPLAWLANILGQQGVPLEAGQLILPGSFTKALPVVAGESATADFGALGALTIHFTD